MTTEEKLENAIQALAFYADPDSYAAILFIPDRPCGEFADDFSDDHGFGQYDRPMPGKLARETLKEIWDV